MSQKNFYLARHRCNDRKMLPENQKKLQWIFSEKSQDKLATVEHSFLKIVQNLCSSRVIGQMNQKIINPARHRFNVRTMFPENMKKLQSILSKKRSGQISPCIE